MLESYIQNQKPAIKEPEKLNDEAKTKFYDVAIKLSQNQGEFSPNTWKKNFLFMTAKDYKNKSIEISMTTISKVKRHATEEIKITLDKTGFKVAIKKDIDWNGRIENNNIENKKPIKQDPLPYLKLIEKKLKEYSKTKNTKQILAEREESKQADDLLDGLWA